MPKIVYDAVWNDIAAKIDVNPEYKRIILPLTALLEGEIFNQYIKTGRALILHLFNFNFFTAPNGGLALFIISVLISTLS